MDNQESSKSSRKSKHDKPKEDEDPLDPKARSKSRGKNMAQIPVPEGVESSAKVIKWMGMSSTDDGGSQKPTPEGDERRRKSKRRSRHAKDGEKSTQGPPPMQLAFEEVDERRRKSSRRSRHAEDGEKSTPMQFESGEVGEHRRKSKRHSKHHKSTSHALNFDLDPDSMEPIHPEIAHIDAQAQVDEKGHRRKSRRKSKRHDHDLDHVEGQAPQTPELVHLPQITETENPPEVKVTESVSEQTEAILPNLPISELPKLPALLEVPEDKPKRRKSSKSKNPKLPKQMHPKSKQNLKQKMDEIGKVPLHRETSGPRGPPRSALHHPVTPPSGGQPSVPKKVEIPPESQEIRDIFEHTHHAQPIYWQMKKRASRKSLWVPPDDDDAEPEAPKVDPSKPKAVTPDAKSKSKPQPPKPPATKSQSKSKPKPNAKPEPPKIKKKKVLVSHYKHFYDTGYIYENEGNWSDPAGSSGDETLGEWNSASEEEESLLLPDMSWILKKEGLEFEDAFKATPEQERLLNAKLPPDPFVDIRHSLQLVAAIGRMPFSVFKDKVYGNLAVKLKPRWAIIDFWFITTILGFLSVSCVASVIEILFGKDDDSQKGHYLNFEKLLLQKHWLYITLFILALVVAFVGNLSILLNQQTLVEYFNDIGRDLLNLNYANVGQGFKHWWISHAVTTVIDVSVILYLVLSKSYGFEEALRFESIVIIRWFSDFAWFKPHLRVLEYFVLGLELYVYLLARNVILLVLVPCRVITNWALHWNLRTRILLGKITREEQMSLEPLRESLTHEGILMEHFTITKLLGQISSCFTAILTVFFTLKVVGICCVMFRIATAFFFNLNAAYGNLTVHLYDEAKNSSEDTHIRYATSSKDELLEVTYFGVANLVGVFVASLTMSAVGETVMSGFDPIRRYGLVFAKNMKERKFILSLQMSFNSASPYVIKPSWFTVDRGLIVGILGGSLLIFSMMIQCNVVNLVEVPIVIPCPNNKGICTKTIVINTPTSAKGNATALQNIFEKQGIQEPVTVKFDVERLPTIAVVTTPTPETTTKPTLKPTTAPEPVKPVEPPILPPVKPNPEPEPKPVPEPPPEPVPNPTPEPAPIPATTSSTTEAPKPPPAPVVQCSQPKVTFPNPKFKPGDSAATKKRQCGEYCKIATGVDSNIYRMDIFDDKGVKLLDFATMSLADCILNPYSKFLKAPTGIYDCFGNCKKESDADIFGHLPFSLDGTASLPKVDLSSTEFGYELSTKGSCYNPKNDNPSFHVLELCGVPFPYLELAKNAAAGTKTDPKALELNSNSLTIQKGKKISPLCNENDLKNIEPNGRLFKKFNYGSKKIQIARMIPFSFLHGKLDPIPLDKTDDTSAMFGHPYAYLHPKYTKKGPVGYFNCLGNQLKEFDECGGLKFDIQRFKPPSGLLGLGNPTPLPEKEQVQGKKGKKYSCWTSPITTQSCGVPKGHPNFKELVDEICAAWVAHKNK